MANDHGVLTVGVVNACRLPFPVYKRLFSCLSVERCMKPLEQEGIQDDCATVTILFHTVHTLDVAIGRPQTMSRQPDGRWIAVSEKFVARYNSE